MCLSASKLRAAAHAMPSGHAMYVITCATSRTGSLVATHLLEAGCKIRVVVRKPDAGEIWRQRGAEVAIADYADVPAMSEALRDAQAAYVIPPPLPVSATGHHAYRVSRTESLARALEIARVPYVVSLSSFAAQHPKGTGMIESCHTCETVLRSIHGTSVTHLRPSFFIDNWAAQIPAARQGVLPSFLGPADRKFTMVGTPDIAAVATRLLLEPVRGNRIVELTGSDDYSVLDIARAFSQLFGRSVEPMVYPVEGMAAMLKTTGFSDDTAANYQELFAAMMTGHVALEGKVPLERGVFGLAYTLGVMVARTQTTMAAAG